MIQEFEKTREKLIERAKEQGREVGNLEVPEGKTIELSPESDFARKYLVELKPENIDEVVEWIGVKDELLEDRPDISFNRVPDRQLIDVSRLRSLHHESRLTSLSPTANMVRVDDLISSNVVVRQRATGLVRAAMRQYVFGRSNRVAFFRSAINRYIQLSNLRLVVPIFNDVTVSNGGRLQLSPSTYAFYARDIRVHGTGRIDCNGPKTIHCRSFDAS
ncbi:MAG: hypothetical protein AAGD38_16855 [Acidobacteriota bacterium]